MRFGKHLFSALYTVKHCVDFDIDFAQEFEKDLHNC
jgi:hypothetical protein